jgi:hypothetical protein
MQVTAPAPSAQAVADRILQRCAAMSDLFIQPAHREALTIPLFVLEELGLLAALTLC